MTALMSTFAPGLFRAAGCSSSAARAASVVAQRRRFGHSAQVIAPGATEVERRAAAEAHASAGIDFASLDARDGSAIKDLLAALERLDGLVDAAGVIRRDSAKTRHSQAPLTPGALRLEAAIAR